MRHTNVRKTKHRRRPNAVRAKCIVCTASSQAAARRHVRHRRSSSFIVFFKMRIRCAFAHVWLWPFNKHARRFYAVDRWQWRQQQWWWWRQHSQKTSIGDDDDDDDHHGAQKDSDACWGSKTRVVDRIKMRLAFSINLCARAHIIRLLSRVSHMHNAVWLCCYRCWSGC